MDSILTHSVTPTPSVTPPIPVESTDINSNSYIISATTYYGSLKLYLSEITKLSSEDISGNYFKYNNDKNIKITLSDNNRLRFNGAYSNIVCDFSSIKDSNETYILINGGKSASNGYIGIDYCCYTYYDIDSSIVNNIVNNEETYIFGYIKVDNVNEWYDCKYTYAYKNSSYNPITNETNIAITDSINIKIGSKSRYNIENFEMNNYGYLGYITLSDISISYNFNGTNLTKISADAYFPFGVNKNLLYNKYYWDYKWNLNDDINNYFKFSKTTTDVGNNYLNFVKPLSKDKSSTDQNITVSSTAFFNADENGPNTKGDVKLTIKANPFNIYVPNEIEHWFEWNNNAYCNLHNSEQAQIYIVNPPMDKDGFHATIILSEGYTLLQKYNDSNNYGRCFSLKNSNVTYTITMSDTNNNNIFDFCIKNKGYTIGDDENETWGAINLGYLSFAYTYNGTNGRYKRSLYGHIGGITSTTPTTPTTPTTTTNPPNTLDH